MDDAGGFIVGLFAFFIVAYVVLTLLQYLLMVALILVPTFYLYRHLARQLRERFVLGDRAKTVLCGNALASLAIAVLFVYSNEISAYWVLAAVPLCLLTTNAILSVWAEKIMEPYRREQSAAATAINKTQSRLSSLDEQISAARREVQDIESRHAEKLRLRESKFRKIEEMCLRSGENDNRFTILARDKITARIADWPVKKIEARLGELKKGLGARTGNLMECLEVTLLEITLLDRQGASREKLRERQELLKSLESKAGMLRRELAEQEQEAARLQEILSETGARKVVLQ